MHVSQGACSRLHQLRKQTPPLSSLTPYPRNCLVRLFLVCTVGGGERRLTEENMYSWLRNSHCPGCSRWLVQSRCVLSSGQICIVCAGTSRASVPQLGSVLCHLGHPRVSSGILRISRICLGKTSPERRRAHSALHPGLGWR